MNKPTVESVIARHVECLCDDRCRCDAEAVAVRTMAAEILALINKRDELQHELNQCSLMSESRRIAWQNAQSTLDALPLRKTVPQACEKTLPEQPDATNECTLADATRRAQVAEAQSNALLVDAVRYQHIRGLNPRQGCCLLCGDDGVALVTGASLDADVDASIEAALAALRVQP